MRLPVVTQDPIEHVDCAPDENYPVRILQAYLQRAQVKWVVEGLSAGEIRVCEEMNKAQDKRAQILSRAITTLCGNMPKEKPYCQNEIGCMASYEKLMKTVIGAAINGT